MKVLGGSLEDFGKVVLAFGNLNIAELDNKEGYFGSVGVNFGNLI